MSLLKIVREKLKFFIIIIIKLPPSQRSSLENQDSKHRIFQTRSLRGWDWEFFTYDLQKWHSVKCSPHFVCFISIVLSVRRFVEGNINLPKIHKLFCLVHIKKRPFLTSRVFWFGWQKIDNCCLTPSQPRRSYQGDLADNVQWEREVHFHDTYWQRACDLDWLTTYNERAAFPRYSRHTACLWVW